MYHSYHTNIEFEFSLEISISGSSETKKVAFRKCLYVSDHSLFWKKKSAYIACTGNGCNSFDKMRVKSRFRCPLRFGIRHFPQTL